MGLQINVDSYITLIEMNEYISHHYVASDPLRIEWDNLTSEDREVYLRRAFNQINALPYTGRPKNVTQKLPFPRCDHFTSEDWTAVKNAQAEQALALTDSVALQEISDRLRLRRAGVVQYKIGDLSEKFNEALPSSSNASFFGLSEFAYNYLKKWLQGGYEICTSIKSHCGMHT